MNQADQVNAPNSSTDAPSKRKRGRPRKYPRLNTEENIHSSKNQVSNPVESTRSPPGFKVGNGTQPRQLDPVDNTADQMLGQAVSGVIEAAFDAGYLLRVKVGNSGTILRGVVFKPGNYIPVSAENDVAPDLQMIRRTEVPVPTENYPQSRSYNPRSGNGIQFPSTQSPEPNQVPKHVPISSNQASPKGKQVSTPAAKTAHPVLSKGNLVPVVLQPANLTNGVPIPDEASNVAIQAAHLANSKGQEVLGGSAFPSNESTLTNVVVGNNKLLLPPPQSSHNVLPVGIKCEHSPCNQDSVEMLHNTEVKLMKSSGMPLEKLVTEVIKRIEGPCLSETQTENNNLASKTSLGKESGHSPEGATNSIEPLLIEPLQDVEPAVHNDSVTAPKPMEEERTGK